MDQVQMGVDCYVEVYIKVNPYLMIRHLRTKYPSRQSVNEESFDWTKFRSFVITGHTPQTIALNTDLNVPDADQEDNLATEFGQVLQLMDENHSLIGECLDYFAPGFTLQWLKSEITLHLNENLNDGVLVSIETDCVEWSPHGQYKRLHLDHVKIAQVLEEWRTVDSEAEIVTVVMVE